MRRFLTVLFAATSAIALCAFDTNSNSTKLKEQADAAQDLNRGFDRDASRGDLLDAEAVADNAANVRYLIRLRLFIAGTA